MVTEWVALFMAVDLHPLKQWQCLPPHHKHAGTRSLWLERVSRLSECALCLTINGMVLAEVHRTVARRES